MQARPKCFHFSCSGIYHFDAVRGWHARRCNEGVVMIDGFEIAGALNQMRCMRICRKNSTRAGGDDEIICSRLFSTCIIHLFGLRY